ncbi:hypothetical protein LNP00_01810 [Fructobacillus sp. M158]|uniref:hypothetical protein n=1 Tax=Fructobacillus parabroussonetiae TaxID=2713174 RepID=UPI00200AFE74|nr:hypothetical protein [Fructobacillus parabroussonetiae]MCK8617106.1 hypothetical protein [Fructobacillus parabroussonetiae]
MTFGNALTIISGAGNGIWTAASLDLSQVFHAPLNATIMLIGFLVIIANIVLLPLVSWRHVAGSVLFVFFFGELIHAFALSFFFLRRFFTGGLGQLLLVVLGILIVCLGTSFYQRANLWMYPTDYLTDILASRFFSGNVWKGQLLAFLPALLLIFLAFIVTGNFVGIQIGTLLALFCNGECIAFFNRFAFPSFRHY